LAKNGALSIDDAWNGVALEERIELISRANGQGIVAALGTVCFLGATAYGFDKIWMLGASFAAALMVMPLFASFSWRRNKSAMILQYLAVRSVARRYAYGFNVTDLDIILIFRGFMEERFSSVEDEMLSKQHEDIELDHAAVEGRKAVWICLMRGGVLMLSENSGGAKPEFFTPVAPEVVCEKPRDDERTAERAVALTGGGPARGRRIIITSDYPGALYVFEKQVQKLLFETAESRRQLLEMVERRAA
jgi:hypothetical protein